MSRRSVDGSIRSSVADGDAASTRANLDSLNIAIPNTSLLDQNPQIVVGVLFKYLNLTSGWRPRLFVLHQGVFKYYKIYGPTAVNVFSLLENLRQEGELYLVGAEVSLLETRDARKLQGHVSVSPTTPTPTSTNGISVLRTISSNNSASGHASSSYNNTFNSGGSVIGPFGSGLQRMPAAHAEVHLQVASIHESKTDARVFSVNSGTATLRLRAECKEDRWVWVEALRACKGAWQGMTPTAASALRRVHSGRVKAEDNTFLERLGSVRLALSKKGAGSDVQDYVENLLTQDHQQFHEMLVAEENKRRTLLEMVLSLENEKRQLETALIVEGQQAQQSGRPGSKRRGGVPPFSDDVESHVPSDDDGEEVVQSTDGGETSQNGSEEEALEAEEEEEGDEEESEFFECESVLLHTRGSSLTDFAALDSTGSGLLDDQQQQPHPVKAAALPPALPSLTIDTATTTQETALKKKQQEEPEWIALELASAGSPSPIPRRDRLPTPAQRERSVSLWSLIKEMVGKDLTRVCLPVYFNEPLSALQKTAEDLEYSELLDEAAALPSGSVDRLVRVAAFAVSAYSSTVGRTAKPFNPLLNETYELVYPEKGFRFLGEKVSHHPTIIAACAEGRGWLFEGDAEVKSKFWGRSIELHPVGVLRLTFSDGDTYAWNKVVTSINNLILGKIYVDHGGVMKVRCLKNGMTAKIRFKETGMLFDKDPRQVQGFIEVNGKRLDCPILHGHWDDALYADFSPGTDSFTTTTHLPSPNTKSSILLWKKAPPPSEPTRYNLTSFAIKLNELTPGLKHNLAPTDCRLRPDQAATEKGLWDEANNEKQRLEHKQRAARKAAERGEPLEPRWFQQLSAGAAAVAAGGKGKYSRAHDELGFKYRGGYWEERAAGKFTGCRDIFGPLVES